MRAFIGMLLLGLGASTVPASAAILTVDGYIETQMNPGTDPNLAIGRKVTLTATYDENEMFRLGQENYSITAPTSFLITAGSYNWIASDEIYDGFPFFTYDDYYYEPDGTLVEQLVNMGNPMLAIRHGKVVGISGFFLRTGSAEMPALQGGSSFVGFSSRYNNGPGEPVITTQEGSGWLSPIFSITSEHLYGNTAQTPDFTGRWDFAADVPEPETWVLLVTGFAMTGAAMRRRPACARSVA